MTPRMLLITDKRTGAQLIVPAKVGPENVWQIARRINALMGTTHWTVVLA